MLRKNLIIHMEGGFGNQLFQYFFGKSYAKKLNRNLYFDNKTGFISDIVYKRKFELPIIDLSSFSILFFTNSGKLSPYMAKAFLYVMSLTICSELGIIGG